ncbi:MAG: protocatechuate 3,4-dioxygenase subunit alpha [Gammaproteobacteria bacterium]
MPEPTAAQTIGPFFGGFLVGRNQYRVSLIEAIASHDFPQIIVSLCLLDAEGAPVNDAMCEIWQANPHGRYDHPADRRNAPLLPGFTGFARAHTDADGACEFITLMPGRVPASAGGLQAPHISVSIFARGLLQRLVTRVYFADDPTLAEDEVLNLIPAARRQTLVAQADPAQPHRYGLTLRLGGSGETVFFDC